MTDYIPTATTLAGFVLTYLVHSTIVIATVACVLRFQQAMKPELRVLSWKLALILPVVSTFSVTLVDIPHFGMKYVMGELTSEPQSADFGAASIPPQPVVPTDTPRDFQGPRAMMPLPSSTVSEWQRLSSGRLASRATRQVARLDASRIWGILTMVWLFGAAVGCLRLGFQIRQLRQLRKGATPVSEPDFLFAFRRLKREAGILWRIDVLQSSHSHGPLAAGVLHPFLLLPAPYSPPSHAERDALLAHELAHIVRRDPLWSLTVQVVCRVFFLQPLNRLAGRQLRREMDFVADLHATRMLGDPSGLAACLMRLASRLAESRSNRVALSELVSGIAMFRSTLGQRIERLLDENDYQGTVTRANRILVMTLMCATSMLTVSVAPRAVAHLPVDGPTTASNPDIRNESMKNSIATIAVLAGLTMPAVGDEQQKPQGTQVPAAELKTTPDKLPEGIGNFNGMLVGRLAAKDVEQGTFLVQVDAVPRVWRNSKAADPKSIVGKTVEVGGVFGRFLDVLVVMKTGETLEFEARHDGGIRLTFPGELLRKVAPYDPEDYPVLPEEFRGFQGAVAARIVKKDPETFELIVEVDRVIDTWDKNQAKAPGSIEGKQMMLAGFWQRKEAYHGLKVGERIEVGLQHIGPRSDHLTVAEFVRKVSKDSPEKPARMKSEPASAVGGLSKELNGFRGMLVGRLVSKDVERGTFTITVDAVPRVWKNNASSNPKSFLGKHADAEGVTGKMLDVLVIAKEGETIEFGALHDGGDRLRVGEVLRKVAPVKPGDYPELPDEFRGFRGTVVAKVIRKDPHLLEIIAEVKEVKSPSPESRAENAKSILGKPVMLAGFWNRKEAFHDLEIGDLFEVGVEHPQVLSDHLSIVESSKKLKE